MDKMAFVRALKLHLLSQSEKNQNSETGGYYLIVGNKNPIDATPFHPNDFEMVVGPSEGVANFWDTAYLTHAKSPKGAIGALFFIWKVVDIKLFFEFVDG